MKISFRTLRQHELRTSSHALRSFTLLELLVSITLLSVLLVMLFTLLNQATSVWQNCEKKTASGREARAALYYLRRDLQSLLVNKSIAFYINPSTETVSFSGSSAPVSNADMLFFISSIQRDAQNSSKNKSDLCAIGYYVAYTKATDDRIGCGAYNLHRYFKSSDETWLDNLSSPPRGLLPSLTNPVSGGLFPAASASCNGDEIVARYVVDFHVRPYRSDASSPFPWPANEKPAFLDISLGAYNDDMARKLQNQPAWTESKAFSVLKLQNKLSLSTRVGIPAYP